MKEKYVDIRDRRKIPWMKIIVTGVCALVFLVLALLIYYFKVITLQQTLFSALVLAVSLVITLIFHEVGHLVAGLLSGYQLLVFRLGPFALCADPWDEEELAENAKKVAEEKAAREAAEAAERARIAAEKAAEKARIAAEKAGKKPEDALTVAEELAQVEEENASFAKNEEEESELPEELPDLPDDEDDEEEEEKRRFHFQKANLSNGFGQCLMSPPEEEDYKEVPYELYLRGGGIGNLISIPISLLFLIFFLEQWYIIATFAVIALVTALCSLLPIRFDGKTNDAYIKNLCDATWDDHASFVNQLQITSACSRGVSVGDMPETWFFGKYDMTERMSSNPLTVAIWQSTADRFLIHGELFQAKIIYEAIGNQPSLCPYTQQNGVYRLLYTMILEGRVEEARIYPIPKFMRRAIKKNWKRHLIFPRYQFGYAKLVIENGKKMKEAKLRYDKIAAVTLLEGERLDQDVLLDQLDDVIIQDRNSR